MDYLRSDLFKEHRKKTIYRNLLSFTIDRRLLSKGTLRTHEVNEIKREINEYMTLSRRKSFRKNVCVSINIFNDGSDPKSLLPNTENIAKNIIDLIYYQEHPEHLESQIGCNRERFPIRDDRQISILCVRNHEMDLQFPSTSYVYVNSHSSFLEAVKYLEKEPENFDQTTLVEKPDSIFDIIQTQEMVTDGFRLTNLKLMLLGYYGTINKETLSTILEQGFFIKLEGGDKSRAKRVARFTEELDKFSNEYPIFKKLYGGIIITIVRVGSDKISQDLDNYLRDVICPVFRKKYGGRKRNRDAFDFDIYGYDVVKLDEVSGIEKSTLYVSFHMRWTENFIDKVFDNLKEDA